MGEGGSRFEDEIIIEESVGKREKELGFWYDCLRFWILSCC